MDPILYSPSAAVPELAGPVDATALPDIRAHFRQKGILCFTVRCEPDAAARFYDAGGTLFETGADGRLKYLFFPDPADAEKAACAIDTLADFLGLRDAETPGALHADLCVLFGGSILSGGDRFAEAMRAHAARYYIIVGGEGHTTEALRRRIRREIAAEPSGTSEAEHFAAYLSEKYGLAPDALETASTNCGNNITNLLDLIAQKGYPCGSAILMQDASMQRRMGATLRKYRPDMKILNFAAYRVKVTAEGGRLAYDREEPGMWELGRYIRLLAGEIPRLRDDENGYGPNGKNYIAHVDIPDAVERAFDLIKRMDENADRPALP